MIDRMETTTIITHNILAMMGTHRVTQGRLAKALGVSDMYLSRRIHNDTAWSVDDLDRIAAYFQVEFSRLITPTDLGEHPSGWMTRTYVSCDP